MTEDERRLLLYVAQQIAETLREKADDQGTTDNLAEEMFKLVAAIRSMP